MHGRYNVAVVGAGHNGLVAAAYLARAGKSVIVLERRSTVGGTASTVEPVPGYRASACFQSAETLSPMVSRELRLKSHGLELSPARGVAVAPVNGPWLGFDGGGSLVDDGGSVSASDRAALAELERLFRRTVGALAPLYRAALPELEEIGARQALDLLRVGWRLRRLGRRDMREAMRLLPMSMRDVVEERFESDALGAAVAGLGLHGGCLGPYAAGSVFAGVHHQLQQPRPLFAGPEFVNGGLGALGEALSSSARASGAEVRTGAEVARIDTAAGRARGVTLEGGEHIEADVVVSDADPRRTFLTLVDAADLDAEFVAAVSNVRASGGVGVVAFALDGLPGPPAGAGAGILAGRIQIGASVLEQERAFDAMHDGRLADRPLVQLAFPSLADTASAPEGKHVATCWVVGVPDNPHSLESSVAAAVEAVLPGFTARVLGCAVATPGDIEERYGVTNGCLFDVDISLDQALFLRPVPGWYGYRTPLRGLYLCGSGTHAGGGISGLPGRNAVRRIIDDLKAGRA